MSASALLARLDGVHGKGPRWRAICPAHKSRHRTRALSVYEPEPGRLLLHCHAGCNVDAIVGAVGLSLESLFPKTSTEHAAPIRKPWRAADVVAALRGELTIAFVLLTDLAHGVPATDGDRVRAGEACERIALLIGELDDAH